MSNFKFLIPKHNDLTIIKQIIDTTIWVADKPEIEIDDSNKDYLIKLNNCSSEQISNLMDNFNKAGFHYTQHTPILKN